MPAASPSFVDQIRTLMNERAALLARRIEIDGQLSLIDAELSEARQLLGATDPIQPAAVVRPPVGPAPAPRPVHDDRRRDEILALLKPGPLPTREIARLMKLDRLVCKMALQRMRKVGLLQTVGERNGQKWQLAGAPPSAAPVAVSTPLLRSKDIGTAFIDARDAAVFARITNNNGVATIQELRKWFLASAVCGSGTDTVKHEALTNTLHRLKAKNQISRTGDTWSTSGAGVGRG